VLQECTLLEENKECCRNVLCCKKTKSVAGMYFAARESKVLQKSTLLQENEKCCRKAHCCKKIKSVARKHFAARN
jgi:hypothetical protein